MMTDIELMNYLIDNKITYELRLINDKISFYLSPKDTHPNSSNSENIPCEVIFNLKNKTGRDFTISSGYNSLYIKFDRLKEKEKL